MFVIVGLGNPGREYALTRHNVGYMTMDLLSSRWGVEIKRHSFHSVFGEGRLGRERVALIKPETFMNNSGIAVREAVSWYKCGHSGLIVVYDDVDIPLGTLRIREGGSSGTHNGMRSVIYQLGYEDFPRVRVGIGRAADERGLASHVLSTPQGEERDKLVAAIKDAAEAVELIVRGETGEAQALFNHKAKSLKKQLADGKEADGGDGVG